MQQQNSKQDLQQKVDQLFRYVQDLSGKMASQPLKPETLGLSVTKKESASTSQS